MTEEVQTQFIIEDGYMVDPETGEIMAHVEEPKPTGFDQGYAEWVLKKQAEAESNINALNIRKTAILDNIDRLRKKEEGRLKWLATFKPQMETFAKANLPKGSKTWLSPYGSVSFRTVKGGVRVSDERLAANTAAQWFDYALVTSEPKFLISKLTAADKAKIQDAIEKGTTEFSGFEVKPDEERADVRTGVQ